VFGGKSDDEASDRNKCKGVFNDLSLFHIEKREWVVPSRNSELPYRFGASCSAYKSRLFVFGGT
jgi:hypothetical protein